MRFPRPPGLGLTLRPHRAAWPSAIFGMTGGFSVVVNNMNAPPSLLVNSIRSPNHWVTFRAVGTRSNRDGIGARISVKAGKRTLVDEVRSGSSYISQNDLRLHFGLGAVTSAEDVRVRWPNGLEENFGTMSVDAIHELREDSGKPVAAPSKKAGN